MIGIKMDKDFHNNLGPLVGMTARGMRRQLNRRLLEAGYEVTAEQLIIMAVLGRQDECNQQWIAEICGKDKTSTTRMIDTMERNGLVQRVADRKDRRQNLIILTDKGRAEKEQMMTHIVATHEQATLTIPPEELKVCKAVLRRVLSNLIEADPTWPGPRLENGPAPKD